MQDSLPLYADFKDSLIAFVDILGMSRLIKAINSETSFINVRNSMYAIKKAAQEINSSVTLSGFQSTGVSDSLIVTVPLANPAYGISLVLLLHQLQYLFLLDFGLLARGYICGGHVCHADGILFGPGYIDAYQGEKLIGGHPRIVLDSRIVETATREIAQVGRENFHFGTVLDFVAQDPSDGFYFIDYLKPAGARLRLPRDQLLKEFGSIKDWVTENLEKYRDDCRIYPKYNWLQWYCGRCELDTRKRGDRP